MYRMFLSRRELSTSISDPRGGSILLCEALSTGGVLETCRCYINLQLQFPRDKWGTQNLRAVLHLSLSQPASLTWGTVKMSAGLCAVMQLLCQQQGTQSPSFPSSTWSLQSPGCSACCILPVCNHTTFSWPSHSPATAPCNADCTWIWEGQTHEKHHGITTTPDCRKMNVLPKALACAVTFHSVPVSELSVLRICPRAALQNVNIFVKIPCDRLQVLIKGAWGCMFVCLFVCFHEISIFFS